MQNLVLVGYGMGLNQRLHHCDAIRKTRGLNLAGIFDTRKESQEEARRCYDVHIYASIDEVLADPRVDAVVIATPNDSHAPLGIRFLEAGKHVVLEKPMCLSTSEADDLIETSRRCGRLLTVRHNRRWDGDYLTVKSVIAEECLGKTCVLDSSLDALIRPSGWRAQKESGGGWFVDWGCHLIDQVLQLVPARPISVFATIASPAWDVKVETFARVLIQFENGVLSEVETSNVSWLPRPRWYVLGEKGSLIFLEGKFLIRTALEHREILPLQSRYDDFYANFSECLNEGEDLLIKPEQVRDVIALIEAAFLSARTGQAVRL
ncbi:MAG: Gfo/Idh/MocA family oxidoreductase [Candidatus Aminicenantes bacterium]|nr:Gfo/Idh/MocA family oxidoreductase [Candidatus Aminicenantes bacterium]